MKVKVISIQQPWASLVVAGHKKIETRSWNTKYRGEIYIHSSKGYKNWQNKLCYTEHFKDFLEGVHNDLPLGAIIGKVNIKEVVTSEDVNYNHSVVIGENSWLFNDQEKAFGDYSPGRYGWLLSDPVLFETPIQAKGKFGILEFEMPD